MAKEARMEERAEGKESGGNRYKEGARAQNVEDFGGIGEKSDTYECQGKPRRNYISYLFLYTHLHL